MILVKKKPAGQGLVGLFSIAGGAHTVLQTARAMVIQKLGPGQKKEAAKVVASAFLHYPMLTHYIPNAERRKRWLPLYMEKTLNCAMHYGEALVTSDLSGVMFVLPPGHTRLTDKEYIQNGFLSVLLVLGFRY